MRELLSQKNLYNLRSKNIFSSKICHWRMSSPQPAMATSDYQHNTRGKAVKYNLLCNSGEQLVNPCKTLGSLDGFDKFVSKLLIWLVRWQIKSEIFENKSQMKFVNHFYTCWNMYELWDSCWDFPISLLCTIEVR